MWNGPAHEIFSARAAVLNGAREVRATASAAAIEQLLARSLEVEQMLARLLRARAAVSCNLYSSGTMHNRDTRDAISLSDSVAESMAASHLSAHGTRDATGPQLRRSESDTRHTRLITVICVRHLRTAHGPPTPGPVPRSACTAVSALPVALAVADGGAER